ncbi:MAG: hypothetical protein WCL25_05360, partial [bacterium]
GSAAGKDVSQDVVLLFSTEDGGLYLWKGGVFAGHGNSNLNGWHLKNGKLVEEYCWESYAKGTKELLLLVCNPKGADLNKLPLGMTVVYASGLVQGVGVRNSRLLVSDAAEYEVLPQPLVELDDISRDIDVIINPVLEQLRLQGIKVNLIAVSTKSWVVKAGSDDSRATDASSRSLPVDTSRKSRASDALAVAGVLTAAGFAAQMIPVVGTVAAIILWILAGWNIIKSLDIIQAFLRAPKESRAPPLTGVIAKNDNGMITLHPAASKLIIYNSNFHENLHNRLSKLPVFLQEFIIHSIDFIGLFTKAPTPTVAGKSAPFIAGKDAQPPLRRTITGILAAIKNLSIPVALIALGTAVFTFGAAVGLPAALAAGSGSVFILIGLAYIVANIWSTSKQRSKRVSHGISVPSRSKKLAAHYLFRTKYSKTKEYSIWRFSIKGNFLWLKEHPKAAIIFGLSGAGLGFLFGSGLWFAILIGAFVGLLVPYLVYIFQNFFVANSTTNVAFTAFERDIEGQILSEASQELEKAMAYYDEVYQNANWLGKAYWNIKAIFIGLSLRLPILTGILQFAASRGLMALVSLGIASLAISLLPIGFAGASVLGAVGLGALAPLFNFFALPYTVAGLMRILFITLGLSLFRISSLVNTIRQIRLGFGSAKENKIDIDQIYLGLDAIQDQAELEKINDNLKAGVLGGLFDAALGRRQILAGKLNQMKVSSPEASQAKKVKSFINYRLVSLALALIYTLLQPVVALAAPILYLISAIRRKDFQNPYLKLIISTGINFISSFFSMWTIGAEIGIVVRVTGLIPFVGDTVLA